MQDVNTLWGNIRSTTANLDWMSAMRHAQEAPEDLQEECFQYIARAAMTSAQSRRDHAYAIVRDHEPYLEIAKEHATYCGVLEVGAAIVTVARMAEDYVLWSVSINEAAICTGHASSLEQGWCKALSGLHDICSRTLRSLQEGDVGRL